MLYFFRSDSFSVAKKPFLGGGVVVLTTTFTHIFPSCILFLPLRVGWKSSACCCWTVFFLRDILSLNYRVNTTVNLFISAAIKVLMSQFFPCFLLFRSNTLWQKPETRSCSIRAKWRTRQTWGGDWPVWRNLSNSTSTWRDRSFAAAGRHEHFV